MPSDKALTNVTTGAGKLHSNVATAAADLQVGSGTEAMLATVVAALQQEIPVVTATAPVAGTGQTSVVLSGATNPIWMGDGGHVEIEDQFRLVTDPYQDAPTETDGTPVYIASMVGAAIGDGWYSGSLTLNFSGPIQGGFWQVFYGTRVTLQSLPPDDVFTYSTLRNTQHVQPNLVNVLRDLHATSGNRDWDDAWLSTIDDLAKSGLNERYRLSTTGLSGGTVDTPGEGAVITRDGQAPTIEATADFAPYFYPSVPADPYTAHFLTRAGPGPQADTGHRVNTDGGTGYVGVLQQRLCNSPTMRLNALAYTQASRMDLIERHFVAATIGSANVRTKVTPGVTAGTLLNPDAGTGFDDRREIELATGDYFWEAGSGNKTSEVALGRDMIEITYAGGDKVIAVITGFPEPTNSRRALVENLTAGTLLFPSGATTAGASFRFIKTKYWQGVGSQQYTDFENGYLIPDGIKLGHFYHSIPPFVTDDITAGFEVEDIGDAEFFARAQTIGQSGVANLTAKPYALKWGGYDPENYVQEVKGGLRGDGAVETTLVSKTTHVETFSSSGAYDFPWHPSLEGSRLVLRMTHASGVVTMILNLDTDYINNVMQPGDEIEVVIINSVSAPAPGGTGATWSITWPSWFQFSGSDDDPIVYNFNSQATILKFQGTFDQYAGKFLMTRTTYMGPGD